MSEQVNHPDHYGGGDNPYEVIKVMEAWDPVMAYYGCIFNVIKYTGRLGRKGELSIDVGKAAWYAARAEAILSQYPEVKAKIDYINGTVSSTPMADRIAEYVRQQQAERNRSL